MQSSPPFVTHALFLANDMGISFFPKYILIQNACIPDEPYNTGHTGDYSQKSCVSRPLLKAPQQQNKLKYPVIIFSLPVYNATPHQPPSPAKGFLAG